MCTAISVHGRRPMNHASGAFHHPQEPGAAPLRTFPQPRPRNARTPPARAARAPSRCYTRTAGGGWLALAFAAPVFPVAILPLHPARLRGRRCRGVPSRRPASWSAPLEPGRRRRRPARAARSPTASADRRTLVLLTIPAALGILGLITLSWWQAPLGVALALAALVGASNARWAPWRGRPGRAASPADPDARRNVEVAMGYGPRRRRGVVRRRTPCRRRHAGRRRVSGAGPERSRGHPARRPARLRLAHPRRPGPGQRRQPPASTTPPG